MNPTSTIHTIADGIDSPLWKLVERAVIAAFMGVIGLIVWQAQSVIRRIEDNNSRIVQIEKFMAVIEGNRFTSQDGLDMQKQLTIISSKMPDRYPPSEWLDTVYNRDREQTAALMNRMMDAQDRMLSSIDRLNEKISVLERLQTQLEMMNKQIMELITPKADDTQP